MSVWLPEELHVRIRESLNGLRQELLDHRTDDGHWVGELSASALSTATAVSAIAATIVHASSTADKESRRMVCAGIGFLATQQNDDGGFGDTDRSLSNIATSYLVLAASALAKSAGCDSLAEASLVRLSDYIQHAGGIDGLRRRYGTDKTFVVPIMTNLAIAGLIPWDRVASLPFEAAVFPQSMYRFLQMPVVSYAIPALVAIGQTRHHFGKRTFWLWRLVRGAAVEPTMRVLGRMQPDSGGYLEATPLTSFVVMSLAVTGRGDHPVTQNGLRFLAESMSEGGSWPIDTNLATWATSLAIDALSSDPDDDGEWASESLLRWHLACQHRVRHPFTGAEPGGWGWTDLSGAVPDSDDTPGAILALAKSRKWCRNPQLVLQIDDAIEQGQRWLIKLQNRNGGWPTFCRGWGKLPFDRSSTDLTGHAIRALLVRTDSLAGSTTKSPSDKKRSIPRSTIRRTIARGAKFLAKSQQEDGSWLPLWFGNQDRPDEDNPVYGTSKVLVASIALRTSLTNQQASQSDKASNSTSSDPSLSDSSLSDLAAIRRGVEYLVRNQNSDGGWGGGCSVAEFWSAQALGNDPSNSGDSTASTVEETALAVDALATMRRLEPNRKSGHPEHQRSVAGGKELSRTDANASVSGGNDGLDQAIIRGVEFLLANLDQKRHHVPWPIGFYFAKLWYHERLYPIVFTAAALGKVLQSSRLNPSDPEKRN